MEIDVTSENVFVVLKVKTSKRNNLFFLLPYIDSTFLHSTISVNSTWQPLAVLHPSLHLCCPSSVDWGMIKCWMRAVKAFDPRLQCAAPLCVRQMGFFAEQSGCQTDMNRLVWRSVFSLLTSHKLRTDCRYSILLYLCLDKPTFPKDILLIDFLG